MKFKMKKRYITGIVAIITFVAITIFSVACSKTTKYETKAIERCTITQFVEASGTINPVNTVSVGSTVSGLIDNIYVDFNSEVKKGQILAQIDPRNFQATVEQNQAQINNALANVTKLQATAEFDKKNFRQIQKFIC